jgi:hypothetical protein
MRFITIEIGCDWTDCHARGPEDSDDFLETTVSVNKRAAKRVTLCLKHHEELNDVLTPLLARGVAEPGEKPARATKAKAAVASDDTPATGTVAASVDVPCRIPGCGQVTRGNVGLAQHLKKKHDGMTRAEHDQLPEPTEAT